MELKGTKTEKNLMEAHGKKRRLRAAGRDL